MTKYTTKQGITVYKINNDFNGNPRYLVSWMALGLDSYKPTKLTRKAGLSKYRGKQFSGGFVFQSYNIDETMKYILKTLKRGGKC